MKKLLLSLSILFMSSLSWAYDAKTYIPPQAFEYKEAITFELDKYFPTLYEYNYIPSLIEHESCISLKHSRCWKSTSQLKSSRELGVGLGQITKAYREDGSIRFDSLKAIRDNYKNELREAQWETIHQRADLQIRIIILMIRDDYKKLYNVSNKEDRLQMTDAAYNGGLGGVLKERRACGLSKNCDPNKWFSNVEKYCLKSKKPLYGGRSACDINRHHVFNVFMEKIPKYQLKYINTRNEYDFN